MVAAGRCGDEEERRRCEHEVVLVNLTIAEAIAGRYRRRGIDDDDLDQVAYEGLVKAVRRYDPDRVGVRAVHDPELSTEHLKGYARRGFSVPDAGVHAAMPDNSTPLPEQSARPLAVVTGASSGIGLELAKQFVTNGFDVIIAALDAELDVAANTLRSESEAQVDPVRVDLRRPEGVADLYDAIRADGRPVAAIALNAGRGQGGAFVDTDLDDELSIIDLNITSTVRLAKLVLQDMVKADDGKVLVTSSIASTMPGSFQAVYNASKSFLQSFTEAVQNELKDTGVSLTSLMPGPTDTKFFEVADMAEDTKVGQSKKDDPATVARQGFEALMSGDARVVGGGLKTKVQEAAAKVMPDKAKAAMHRSMAEPGSGG